MNAASPYRAWHIPAEPKPLSQRSKPASPDWYRNSSKKFHNTPKVKKFLPQMNTDEHRWTQSRNVLWISSVSICVHLWPILLFPRCVLYVSAVNLSGEGRNSKEPFPAAGPSLTSPPCAPSHPTENHPASSSGTGRAFIPRCLRGPIPRPPEDCYRDTGRCRTVRARCGRWSSRVTRVFALARSGRHVEEKD